MYSQPRSIQITYAGDKDKQETFNEVVIPPSLLKLSNQTTQFSNSGVDRQVKEWHQCTESFDKDLPCLPHQKVLKNDVPLNSLLDKDSFDAVEDVLQQCTHSVDTIDYGDLLQSVQTSVFDPNESLENPSMEIQLETIQEVLNFDPSGSFTSNLCLDQPFQDHIVKRNMKQSKQIPQFKNLQKILIPSKSGNLAIHLQKKDIAIGTSSPCMQLSSIHRNLPSIVIKSLVFDRMNGKAKRVSTIPFKSMKKESVDSDDNHDWLQSDSPPSVASTSTATTSLLPSVGEAPPYHCPHQNCAKVFKNAISLRKHLTHHGPRLHVCNNCGKAFAEASKLKRHQLVHTGERSYECNYPGCGARFSLHYNLQIHQRVHTGCKPFACSHPGCDKQFAQKINLTSHMRVHASIFQDRS